MDLSDILIILMAKHPAPGNVKTRLVTAGFLDPRQAADLAAAMVSCTVGRLHRDLGMEIVLALTGDAEAAGPAWAERLEAWQDRGLRIAEQGAGGLGERISRLWGEFGSDRAVLFLGADTPDLPLGHLQAVTEALGEFPLAVGRASDGGYWGIAGKKWEPAVLLDIDWGSGSVYDQTLRRAQVAGLGVGALPEWHDVDRPEDVAALFERVMADTSGSSVLAALANEMNVLLGDVGISPGASRSRGAGPAGSGVQTAMNPENMLTQLDREISDEALPDLSKATILLVDDNLQNLELMQAYLEELPCRLLTAADGVEAVEIIDRDPPDLVLLDVMMPRMSGFEVCQKIKAMPRTRDVVVIMVTALHEVADLERAVECGTDDFLTKPVNKLELLTRVKSLLRVSLLRRTLDQVLAQTSRPSGGEG